MAATSSGSAHGYIHRKDDYLKRLRRIEGQARGLQRMVEDEKYCIDILTQVSAMTKALHAVSIGLLEDHMNHCVVDAARAGDCATLRGIGRRQVDGDGVRLARQQADVELVWPILFDPLLVAEGIRAALANVRAALALIDRTAQARRPGS